MKKILYIAPHLSTGGMPQYLLKTIEDMQSSHDVSVVEYDCISQDYTVQRDGILDYLDGNPLGTKFYSLTNVNKETQLLDIIETGNFDIVHFQEIPELFMDDWIAKEIYKQDRPYTIIETSHTVRFDPLRKKYYPDEFVFVSEYQKQQYEKYFDIPIHVVEYPVGQSMINKSRDECLTDIGLGTSLIAKHILVVGLFTPDKNQRYAFAIARHMPNVMFHFVGNLAENFKDYWEPLLQNKPANCIIHGEKDNLDEWYPAMDMLLFPSYNSDYPAECNPIVIKEALSWRMRIFMFRMDSLHKYDGELRLYYLSGRPESDALFMGAVLS